MATKDCTFFVDIDGRQVEMDFDGFRAYLMQDGVMATLAPDLTAKRGKKAGFTVTAQKAEPTPARAEAPKARAEGTTKKTEAPAPTELEVSAENLRKLMPKLGKRRAEAIIAVMKAMGIPFDRLKLAKGKVEAKGTFQQADVKARDAEYMAAVKAGDTAKAQKMVDEAAKAAGYNETGSHGLAEGKLEGNRFDTARLGTNTQAASARLGFFFGSKETAKTYAKKRLNFDKAEEVASMARAIITPLLDVIPKGKSRELDFVRDNIGTVFSPQTYQIEMPDDYVSGIYSEVARLIDEALFVADDYGSTEAMLDAMVKASNKAVSFLKRQSGEQDVVGPNGESLTELAFSKSNLEDDDIDGFSFYLKDIASLLRSTYPEAAKAFKDAAALGSESMSSEEQALRDALRKAQEALDDTLGSVPFYGVIDAAQVNAVLQMSNPFVYDQEGKRYREQTYFDVIRKAKEQGHDSVIIKNTYDGGPLDDIKVVFEPRQIKSADPITYDDKGNVIPLSQRFKPESPDIRYQGEAGAEDISPALREALTEGALQQSSWKDWYEEHQETLDDFFGDYAQQFQDILSVTSQAASVKANVGLALKAFGQWHRGEAFTGYLPAVRMNLERLRSNSEIQGQKISTYKRNNDGTVDEAVIDRHITRLIFGVDSPSRSQFKQAQDILAGIAREIGWTARQVQAALWAHSIVKSGKTPESYGAYLRKLEAAGTLKQRIGELSKRGRKADAGREGRGRFAPRGAKTLKQEGRPPLAAIDRLQDVVGASASPLGSITFIDDLNALISVFEKANFSTVLHEAMHFYRRHMLNTENGFTVEEIKRFERWAGAKNGNWTVAAEEKAARAFEKYLRDGLAPIPELRDLFRRVAQWMREVYATLTGSPVDIDIPADIRQVFDRIFTLEAERQRKAGGQATPAAGTQSLQQADTKARDAEYMAAVEAGDTAKAQKMVDEAARATGYGSEKFYHGTVDIWTIANTADRAKTFDTPNAFGDNIGLFLSSRRNTAKHFAAGRYSPNQTQVTYDITYPDGGTIRNAADTRQEAEEFVNSRDGFVITESSKRTKASADEQLIYTFRHNIQNPKKYTSLRAFVDDVRVNGTSQASLIAEGYDGVSIKGGDLFARNEEWLVVFDPSQIKSADPITYDDRGNVIPLSQRFKPESPDIRYQEASATPTSAVVEAAKKWAGVSEVTPSLSEAQGKVYAAVYKANESRLLDIAEQYTVLTRKMQETMLAQPLDTLAKAVPLGSVFVQGARNQPGSTDATIKPKLVDYVMDSLDDALFDWMYEHLAEHTGVPVSQWHQRRDIRDKFTIAEQITATDKQKAGSAQSLRDNKNRFTTGKPFLVQVYHGTSEAGIAGHQFSSGFGGAATGAESATRGFFFAGSQLTSLAYAMDAVPAQGRITAPRVLTFFVKMRNPLVYDMKGVEYREKSYNDILIQAAEKGHDGVVITNTYDGGPLDNIFVVLHGNEKQIKSADPVTYDDAGKPIPIGKRFQGTADIRYQREGKGVPQAETATAAYRRAMKEQQQEKAAKALQSLNQPPLGWRKPVTFAPAQPRPSLEITPMNRRAVIEAMEELREFRRALELRGVNITNASDVDLDRWEQLLNRIEQLGKVNPITPQMDAEYSKVVRELQARYKSASARDLAKQALEDDKFIALHDKAAALAFGMPSVVPGSTHATADNLIVERRLAARVLNLDASKAKEVGGLQVLLAILKDTAPTGVLAGHRKAIFEVIQRSFHADKFVRKATTLSNWRRDITDYVEDRLDRFTPERLQHLARLTRYILDTIYTRSTEAATVKFKTGEPALVAVYRGGDLLDNEFQSRFLGSSTKAPSARMGYFFAGRSATSLHYSWNVQRYAVAMYNPFVYDYKGTVYREESLGKVIMGAWMDGHDGVIATNIYDPSPIDNVFVIPPGGENRIKTYGLAYDAKGKVIPLSERFNPTTKNVLYQGEDPLPNPEGTSTEAFRRKQAEQRQKNIMDAMNRLRQGQAQASKGEPKTAQPKAAKEPSQARQGQTRAPRAARTAASTPRRGFGGKSFDEIFDALLRQAKAGQLGVPKNAPATPSELLEERIKRGVRDVLIAVYNKRVQPESVVDAVRNAAAELLAAHQTGKQSEIDAATAEFRQLVSESRKAIRPKVTVAERYAKMMGRIDEKPKPAAKATPAELAEMTVRQLLRRMEKQLKVAKSQGIDVEQMEVNGATVSRKEFFVNAADEYQDAYVKQDVPRQQAAYDRMRMAVDTIVTSLQKGKSRPLWHGLRSPLSYANVIGSYEGVMGQLGAEISELFKRTRTDINNQVMTFSEGMSFLQEQMNKVYKPLMKAQGYYGMPAIIDEHIKYLRFTAAFSARYTKIRKEQSIFKDPKAWYTTRRELSRELIDGQSAAFPMAAAMIKSVVYTAKLKYNLKSASTNYISLALSVGPYMRANELADIIYEAAKPSTWNRKVAGDRTLRDVAVGETGGRQAEGAPADEGLTHWWHRKDIFQLSSEHVRIAGYLVGERMAEREDQKLRAEGKAPLSDYVKARLIRDWIEKVEFDNSPWNIAPLFRGPVASVAFQFKPFLQKNVERFIADLQRDPEAFVLSDPRTPLGQITNKIPWKYRRVIGTIGQQVMWGGIGSLLTAVPYLKPLAGVFILAGLMNALKGMTDDDEFAEDLAVAIYYGAPAAIGTDLSSSVGFFEEPYGKTVHEQAVNFFLGPLASTALNVVQEDIKFLETAQKEPRLGGEEEKRKEMLRRGINIAKQVTPYVRMLESAVDLAQGEGSTMRLDKEEELTKWETAIRALGGAPLKQTMFFDEKEAYGWQKSLLGKPTGFERLKKKEGESDASYFRRKAKTDQWERTYLRRLEQNPRYRRLKPKEQEAVRENLWRNFAEESGKLRPDTSKFDASGLLERRAERVRSR